MGITFSQLVSEIPGHSLKSVMRYKPQKHLKIKLCRLHITSGILLFFQKKIFM